MLADLHINVWRQDLLPTIERAILGRANMKAMKDPSGKTGLMRIYEFAKGIPPETFALTGKYRDLRKVMKHSASRAGMLGRRVQTLHFPPDWPADGIFEVAKDSEFGENQTIRIRHKFTDEVQTIPPVSAPPFSQPDDLFIDCNWSEIKATLSSLKNPSGSNKLFLCQIFTRICTKEEAVGDVSYMTPPHKKCRFSTPLKAEQKDSGSASSRLGLPDAAPVVGSPTSTTIATASASGGDVVESEAQGHMASADPDQVKGEGEAEQTPVKQSPDAGSLDTHPAEKQAAQMAELVGVSYNEAEEEPPTRPNAGAAPSSAAS